jgi:hypothetical protein
VARHFPNESADELADCLVGADLLTSFQAHQLRQEESPRLVLGQYRILDELGRGGWGTFTRPCTP